MILDSMLKFIGKEIEKLKYKVGDIYITVNPEMNTAEKVAERFGGTWEQIKDRFMLCAGGTYTLGSTGGEANHTLTASEIPAHTHPFSATTSTKELTGSILDMASQSKNIDIDANGCFTPFQSGTARAYGTSVTEQAFDSVTFNGSHSHSVSGTTGAVGSSQAHNNMPPYLAIYAFKKISELGGQ